MKAEGVCSHTSGPVVIVPPDCTSPPATMQDPSVEHLNAKHLKQHPQTLMQRRSTSEFWYSAVVGKIRETVMLHK